MRSTIGSELQARLDALATRLETSLARARERPERPTTVGDHHALAAKLDDAEARAHLQAQRCQALEDRLVELEAALDGARAARAQAEALAESARQPEHRNGSLDAKLAEALQTKLLEVERLTSELVELRRSNEEWRGRARSHRRELDGVTSKLERATAALDELRSRDEANSKRLAELERLVAEQRRELEVAERRAKHLREHMR